MKTNKQHSSSHPGATEREADNASSALGDRGAGSQEPTAPSLDGNEEELLEEVSDDDPSVTEVRPTSRVIGTADFCIIGLFVLAIGYTLYFARPLLLPLLFAILLNFLLSPVVRTLHRRGIPRVLSAGLLLASLISLLFFAAYRISAPAGEFVAAVPSRLPVVEHRLRGILLPMQKVRQTAEEVGKAAGGGDNGAIAVAVRGPDLMETVVDYGRSFGAGALITLILLVFLLSMDQLFLHKLVRVLPTFHDKRLAVEIFREIENDISRYLTTVTLINTGLGAAVATALYFIGVPNPVMWGVMAGLLNYIPYLGPGIAFILLSFVGIVAFDEVAWMFVPAGAYLALNILEAYCVTPLTLGNRLNLNPVAILLSLAGWSFIWGIPGMLIAVPLLVMVKLFCDHIERLNPISEFLSGAEPSPRNTDLPEPDASPAFGSSASEGNLPSQPSGAPSRA